MSGYEQYFCNWYCSGSCQMLHPIRQTTTLNIAPICTVASAYSDNRSSFTNDHADSGSVNYTRECEEHDTGPGCTDTAFNLSVKDSDSSGTNFLVPSGLSSSTVSLAPGASIDVTMTVTAVSGKMSGMNNTFCNWYCSGGHGKCCIHTATTTLNIAPICTVAAPTLVIAPSSQTITADGGSVSYTVNVKNNDTGLRIRTNSTFNLSVTALRFRRKQTL